MGLFALGGAGVAYGVTEAKMYRVREYDIPVLPPGAPPCRVLQVSDLHLRSSSKRLMTFVESLSIESYDVVLATGDLMGEPESVEDCIRLLSGLRATKGKYYVLGSSDYFAPTFKTYFDYFLKIRRHGARRNPTSRLKEELAGLGWEDLTNRTTWLELGSLRIQVTGLDDPYLNWDDRSVLIREAEAEVALCVVHDPGPYQDALDAGFDLVVSGHTHGGQVRVPFIGAVVTNSTLPTKFARGLSRIGRGWLFVTPGLGVAKLAPFRFLCPPEASVLNLLPRAPSDED